MAGFEVSLYGRFSGVPRGAQVVAKSRSPDSRLALSKRGMMPRFTLQVGTLRHEAELWPHDTEPAGAAET